MVKRLVWLGIGVTVGVIVVRKLMRTQQALSPTGVGARLRDTAATAGDSLRNFMEDVSDGMREREAELRFAIETGQPVDELLYEDDVDDR